MASANGHRASDDATLTRDAPPDAASAGKPPPGPPPGSPPGSLRLDDQLCFALYAASNALTRSYRPLLGALGLTYPQYLVMLVLWQDGPRTVREIGERLRLPANAMTPLLDRLETAGFVARRRDDADRRIVRVSLTPAGRDLQASAAEAQRDVLCQTGLEAQAHDALRAELHRLVDRMEGRAATRAPEGA